MFLICFLILHLRKQPYYTDDLNNIESISLLILIFVIYFGLFYLTGKNDDYTKSTGIDITTFICVFLITLYFIVLTG